MADSPYKTFSNIYTAALQDFKEQTSTEMVTLCKRWVNEGQEQIILRKKRDYLNKTYSINLEASVETSFTVTNGSTTVTKTGTSTLPITSLNEHKFKIQGDETVYDVSSFSSTTITLANAFVGSSSTSATGLFFQSSIFIDADIRSIHKVYHEKDGQVLVLSKGPEDFRDMVQRDPAYLGPAKIWSLYGFNNVTATSGTDKRRLVIYPYPEDAYVLHFDANIHIPLMSNTDDEPLIPIQHRQILYWYAVMKLGQYHQDADMISFGTSNFNAWLERLDGEFMPEKDLPGIKYDNTRWINKGKRFRNKYRFD